MLQSVSVGRMIWASGDRLGPNNSERFAGLATEKDRIAWTRDAPETMIVNEPQGLANSGEVKSSVRVGVCSRGGRDFVFGVGSIYTHDYSAASSLLTVYAEIIVLHSINIAMINE